ncbi:2-hydroxy-3-oxopropionate reductase [Sporosarcina cascadiensis]|uniref:2-hydroxy-3-oxopropionate reductase n=1 Tax=Sporosarcina cascadiensis TaxID=2660747 RepID=UPI00129A7548|nr:2-hydroxy-3-oxopropionate reductase [Sporosarcina cascadiensis]
MKIGFLGLGIMGKPMAKNLLKAGYELVVCSSRQETNQEMERLGAYVAASPCELAERSNLLITMLPNSPEVKEVLLGKEGLINCLKPGSTVVDMSSINPNVSKELYAELKKKEIDFLDAPVSGGEPKAIEGTVSVMVGGEQEAFDEWLPVLQSMAGSVIRVGDTGAGNATKLANQIIVAVNIAAVSEALALAKKMDINPELVYDAIRGGLAGSTVMDAKVPLLLKRDFEPGFKVKLHLKDLNNVKDALNELDMELPLASFAKDVLEELVDQGLGEEDHGAIAKYYEQRLGLTIESE